MKYPHSNHETENREKTECTGCGRTTPESKGISDSTIEQTREDTKPVVLSSTTETWSESEDKRIENEGLGPNDSIKLQSDESKGVSPPAEQSVSYKPNYDREDERKQDRQEHRIDDNEKEPEPNKEAISAENDKDSKLSPKERDAGHKVETGDITIANQVADSTIAGDNIHIRDLILIGNEKEKGELIRRILPGYEAYYEERITIHELTKALPRKEFSVSDYKIDQIDYWASVLRQQRIIFISSLDTDIAVSASYELMDLLSISRSEDLRLLDIERITDEGTELRFDTLLTYENKSSEECAVLIMATSNKARTFLDSALKRKGISSGSVKQELLINRQFWICLYDPMLYKAKSDEGDTEKSSFFHWHIDFLHPLLKQHFPKRFAFLLDDIKQQEERGLWGSNEQERYKLVMECLESKILEQEIEKRNDKNYLKESILDSQELKPVKADDLFRAGESIENTVLFVATFFQSLNPKEFHKVVTLLLGDTTTTFPVKSSVTSEDGVTKMIETEQEKRLVDLWENDPDRVLTDCNIETTCRKDTTWIVGFSEAYEYIREDIEKYINKSRSMYLEKQYLIIQSSGLLFDKSLRIADCVIQLAVKMAVRYPDTHGIEWLTSLVIGTSQHSNTSVDTAKSQGDVRVHVLARIEDGNMRQFVLERIASLIREMLRDTQLEIVVDKFLNGLFESRFYAEVFDIVGVLRYETRFNIYNWIKRLLDQGPANYRIRSYNLLFQTSKIREATIYYILEIVNRWLPEPERSPETYSFSNEYALRFVLNYCLETSLNYDASKYGIWPSSYPLFKTRSDKDFERGFSIVVNCLYHRGMETISVWNIHILIASLIVEWASILLLKEKEESSPEALERFIVILRLITEKATPTQREELQESWAEMKEYLLEEIYKSDCVSENIGRVQLTRRHVLIGHILEEFKRVCELTAAVQCEEIK